MNFSTPFFYFWRLSLVSIALSTMLLASSFEDGLKAFDKKDYVNAIKIWEPLAATGNMAAQYNLGILYENGYGVKQNDSEAFEWYLKAAKQGHIDSQYNVGLMCGAGIGIQKSDELAVKWFSKAAAQGDQESKKILKTRYANFVSSPEAKALKKTDESPVVVANKKLKKSDKNKPKKVLVDTPKEVISPIFDAEIAVQNDPIPVVQPTVSEEVFSKENDLPLTPVVESGAISEAAKWLMKSAKQGEARAQYSLALLYAAGNGVPRSDVEAARWYASSARQGNADAQYNLALAYLSGRGVSKSDSQSVTLLSQAAQQGHLSAQFNLGLLYAEGRGVAKNETEAIRWYMQAAKQGHADAQFSLGVAYAEGNGVSKNENEAIKWYRKAAEQGHSRAQYNLGVALSNR